MEVIRRKSFLPMVSTAGNALILTSSVLSTVLDKRKSEIILKSNFLLDN
jgi:hypothetical protein